MTTTPLVSVVIPNYNYASVLGLCLRSVQAQTYPSIEIILVDDCSTDDSVQVARSLGISAIQLPINGGVCAARNVGAARARGDIIFFLDSDVALAREAIAIAVDILRSDPQIGAVCGNYDMVPLIRGRLVEEYRNLFRHWWMGRADGGRVTGFLNCAILAIPAKVWAEVGPWSTELVHSEGTVVIERLTKRYEVRLDSRVLGRHDDDATLGIALRKVFTRTHQHVPYFLQRKRVAGVVGSSESGASLAAVLTVLSLSLPFLLGAPLIVVPALMLSVWLALDARLYAYVFRIRGVRFGFFFLGMHFLVNLCFAAGAAAGILRWLASGSFRRLHEEAA
jgi:cellulose synthase/poly-beta-1,6-N-acetylglucosamine synthase-like glycosyltransferase